MLSCSKKQPEIQTKTTTIIKTDTIVKTNTTIVYDTVFSPKYTIEIRNKALCRLGYYTDTLFVPQLTLGVIATGTITVLIQAHDPLPPYNYQSPGMSVIPHDTLNWYPMPFDAVEGGSIISYSLSNGKVLLNESNSVPYPYFLYNFKITINL